MKNKETTKSLHNYPMHLLLNFLECIIAFTGIAIRISAGFIENLFEIDDNKSNEEADSKEDEDESDEESDSKEDQDKSDEEEPSQKTERVYAEEGARDSESDEDKDDENADPQNPTTEDPEDESDRDTVASHELTDTDVGLTTEVPPSIDPSGEITDHMSID